MNFSTPERVKVIYNDGTLVFEAEVSPSGFLTLLDRIQQWHKTFPHFKGILVTMTHDVVLIQPKVGQP